MRYVINNGLELGQIDILNSQENVEHFFSTRKGGFSLGVNKGLNLGFNQIDEPSHVQMNRMALCKALDIQSNQLIVPKQTHSANVEIIYPTTLEEFNSGLNTFDTTDALVTNIPNIFIAVLTADCVPVLLFDPVEKVIAAVHAGWKGTAQGIVQNTVRMMSSHFNTDPMNIITAIGPSISSENYEVGEEVKNQYAEKFEDHSHLVFARHPLYTDKYFLDLWKANRHQLESIGVRYKNIEISNVCTYTDAGRYFSARRDKGKTGRQLSGIMLKKK
ncbi:peptidoglycan editing factor PgeF [Aureibacter tunicatorum]|uniref:Purine nucleoside phosphorylase n=1 Tax=Aureibacter tunicatorum TaxID=866807 RepID=A0AAE3XKY4_9BACT|nr:peptidoglycan editing factor PgeF [Aureibacter tunicatorum]MDR6238342.1 hypothetical protein [Aureibacter tunicatorum]BDD03374.1 laccase domain protein [Aureibacter tunicatorum]